MTPKAGMRISKSPRRTAGQVTVALTAFLLVLLIGYDQLRLQLSKKPEPPSEKRTCEIYGESPMRNVPAKCLNFWLKDADDRPQELYIDPEELVR